MRSNRSIAAVFHRVDAPMRIQGRKDRVSIVLNVSPWINELITPYVGFGKSDFIAHSYQEHVMYAAKKYTTLSEHVKFLPKDGKIFGASFAAWNVMHNIQALFSRIIMKD